eukprot:CCRYP_007218-RA/>CCRYP_007218-RA protein AED:0.43 eAED:0.44 QI:0/0/0/1/0/0.5/2/0/225
MPSQGQKTTYFKLTLPNTGNELKVAVWASGTPEQFLLHVRSAIHACKQMGLDTDFGSRRCGFVRTAGAKPFELYGNLLSDEARQPWEKIIKAQVTKAPWEDIKEYRTRRLPRRLGTAFTKGHASPTAGVPMTLARPSSITSRIRKKPNRVSIRQFLSEEQLNSYLETLPCLYYSPKANQATKKVLPLDDADLATHLLRMCPAKWQTQYDLTENTTPVSTRACYWS